MEVKISIAEILKDKPQGTKLYDLLYNVDVELDTISTTDTETVVWCTNETDNNTTCHRGYSEFGTLRGCSDGLQILLPSKEMRDWHKFNWKKGDVLISVDKRYEIIFDKFVDDTYMSIVGKHCLLDEGYCGTTYIGAKTFRSDYFELQTEDTAKALYCAIEAKLGGKINRQTLEVEKPHPEFKDGDIAFVESHMLGINTSLMIAIFRKEKEIDKYKFSPALCESNVHDTYLREYPVVLSPSDIKTLRPATDSEKQQLFDALEKEGKAWDAEKKQIVDLKPKWTPKPFDKIVAFEELGRKEWVCDMFSHYSKDGKGREVIVGIGGIAYSKAVPFNEKTAKLIGTTKEWKG